MFKAGKVSILGRPNVGKSTLLNALIKEKLAIVSEKPETTRDNICGIISGKDFQVVFIDTPGIHKPRHLLGKVMVRKAESSLSEIDIAIIVIDASDGICADDIKIIEMASKKTKFLVINKIDKIDKPLLLPIIENIKKFNFHAIIPVSALRQNGLEILFKKILEYLPEGLPMFPTDQLTDKSERFCIQEIIREKVIELTYKEIPYCVAVSIEEMNEKRDRLGNPLWYIRSEIYVEKQSQRKIIIGKDGSMLKKIGELSRKEIEGLLQKKVFLELYVKLFENWRKDPYKLKRLGYI